MKRRKSIKQPKLGTWCFFFSRPAEKVTSLGIETEIKLSIYFRKCNNNSSGRATERGVHALESHRVCSLVSQQADT